MIFVDRNGNYFIFSLFFRKKGFSGVFLWRLNAAEARLRSLWDTFDKLSRA